MRRDRIAFAFRALAGVASAAGLFAAFPPFDQSVNAWTALAPLLVLIRLSTPGQAAKWAFASGFLFWMATLSWFPAIIKNNGPWPLVLLGQTGLSLWCALFWAAFAFLSSVFWRWIAERCVAHASALRLAAVLMVDPVLWMGCEFLRGWLFSGFAWNFLGVSQVDNLPALQVSAWLGVYGVSGMVMLVNGSVAGILQRIAEQLMRRIGTYDCTLGRLGPRKFARMLESAVPFLAAVAIWCAGASRVRSGAGGETAKMRIAVIQPNTPCIFTADNDTLRLQTERLLGQTRMAGAVHPGLVVWPESASWGLLPEDAGVMRFLSDGANAANCPVLSGGTEVVTESGGTRRYYNAAFLVAPFAGLSATYRKQHLVPFGEYIPGDKWIKALQKLAPTGISCTPGRDAAVMTIAGPDGKPVKIGALICFEDTIPALSRAAARAGAGVLALLTNDAWFNGSCEPLQHQQQSVFRAVENGIPLIRSANSGVSCIVDRKGRVKRLESDGKVADFHGFLVGEIETDGGTTFYTRFGDIPLLVLFFLFAGGIFVCWKNKVSQRKRWECS
ncbi:MAG: apolipoprotein N-acyltransferase [Kiritimatiellae bacterium]|nr:apolipoprotein N-acyltransferase [Kiritimatiellia bacterium]